MPRPVVAALLALVLAPIVAAQDGDPQPEGVRVFEAGKRVTFEVLKDATWDAARWYLRRKGLGSGIGFRKDGWIITTSHQLNGARSVTVICPDGIARKADHFLYARGIDIGVVHIPGYVVPEAVLGSSARLRVGQPIYALGCPHGFRQTITKGIVGGVHREIFQGAKLMGWVFQDYIQMDAQANAGHSGGPMLNRRGEVVGLITASLHMLEDGPPAMCFGLPIETVRTIADRLIAEQTDYRPGGLEFAARDAFGLPAVAREKYGIERVRGAVLYELGKREQAAGLRIGDVVTAVDETSIHGWMHFRVLLATRKPGTKATIHIARAGKPMKVEIAVGQWKYKEGR